MDGRRASADGQQIARSGLDKLSLVAIHLSFLRMSTTENKPYRSKTEVRCRLVSKPLPLLKEQRLSFRGAGIISFDPYQTLILGRFVNAGEWRRNKPCLLEEQANGGAQRSIAKHDDADGPRLHNQFDW